ETERHPPPARTGVARGSVGSTGRVHPVSFRCSVLSFSPEGKPHRLGLPGSNGCQWEGKQGPGEGAPFRVLRAGGPNFRSLGRLRKFERLGPAALASRTGDTMRRFSRRPAVVQQLPAEETPLSSIPARASRTMNRLPPPELLSTSTFPPIAAVARRAIASPRPTPPATDSLSRGERKNGSNTRGRSSGVIPQPLSSTIIRGCSGSPCTDTRTAEPGRLYLQ